MGGYANVSGKAEITAKAYTVDESDAYATSKGVQLKRQENKFGKSIDDILNGKGADDESKLPASQKVLNGDDSVHNDEKSPLGDNKIDELAETKNVDQQTGNTSQGTKISVAAAVAVNIIEHNVTASVSGKIVNAQLINVFAQNENNFITYATGTAVNNGNAISVAIAV